MPPARAGSRPTRSATGRPGSAAAAVPGRTPTLLPPAELDRAEAKLSGYGQPRDGGTDGGTEHGAPDVPK